MNEFSSGTSPLAAIPSELGLNYLRVVGYNLPEPVIALAVSESNLRKLRTLVEDSVPTDELRENLYDGAALNNAAFQSGGLVNLKTVVGNQRMHLIPLSPQLLSVVKRSSANQIVDAAEFIGAISVGPSAGPQLC